MSSRHVYTVHSRAPLLADHRDGDRAIPSVAHQIDPMLRVSPTDQQWELRLVTSSPRHRSWARSPSL